MNQLYGRQGDVGFVQCAIPTDAKRIKIRPFALGEVTGHSHRIIEADHEGAEMFEVAGENGEVLTFLRVTKEGGISIQHEDHDPTAAISKLPQGWEGAVRIAGEYHPAGVRSVID